MDDLDGTGRNAVGEGGRLPRRALIIHLAGATGRAANVDRVSEHLRAAGIEEVEVLPAVAPPDAGPMYSVGEWGCYQSHSACLRRAAADPSGAMTMVVEDDISIRLAPDALRDALLDASTIDWDLLYLGHSGWTMFRGWDPVVRDRAWHPVRGIIWGTTCYVVRSDGFARLVDEYDALAHESPLTGGGVGADGAFNELAFRHPEIVRLAPVPPLAEEVLGLGSTIRAGSSRWREARAMVRRRLRDRIRPLEWP